MPPATADIVYADHAATTPLDPRVLDVMRPYLEREFANPSSLYTAARQTRQALEDARATVARTLGCKPTEVIFTSGGTESNNLAIQGVLEAQPASDWVTTAIEHDSVLGLVAPMHAAGHPAMVVPVKTNGIVDPGAVLEAITDETVLVSIMLANNEIGTIQPIATIAQGIVEIRQQRGLRELDRPLRLHVDATQAANYLDLQVVRLGVDLLSLSGSKIYGPKGTGILYLRHGTDIKPLMYGGGQERGRRSGTENVAGAVGMAEALAGAQTERESENRRIATLRDQLIRALMGTIPASILNGDPKRRLGNNLNLTIPGADGEAMVLYLDKLGILASTGSACSSGDLDPSHVLLAIGRSSQDANASLRLTLGRTTTAAQTERIAQALPPIVERLREMTAA